MLEHVSQAKFAVGLFYGRNNLPQEVSSVDSTGQFKSKLHQISKYWIPTQQDVKQRSENIFSFFSLY